jgi:hypothetical protein
MNKPKKGNRFITMLKLLNLINPIPKEVWDEMPDDFKKYIRKEIRSWSSWVSYSPPMHDEKYLEENQSILSLGGTIAVSHGPLAVRIYNAKTGALVGMS